MSVHAQVFVSVPVCMPVINFFGSHSESDQKIGKHFPFESEEVCAQLLKSLMLQRMTSYTPDSILLVLCNRIYSWDLRC